MEHIKYPKIPYLFELDRETHKYNRHLLTSEHFRILEKNEWMALEKVDGQNIGIVWDGNSVSYQGRTPNTTWAPFQTEYLDKRFTNNPDFEILMEQTFGDKKVVLYCELYGYKIGTYGPSYSDDLQVMLFDVYEPDRDLWYDIRTTISIAHDLGLDSVVIRTFKSLEHLIEEMENMNYSYSHYTSNNKKSLVSEGYVCYPEGQMLDRQHRRIRFKIKYRDFEKGKVI